MTAMQSLTISAFRAQVSTSPLATARPLDPGTGKFSSHSNPNTTRRSIIQGSSEPALLSDSLRKPFFFQAADITSQILNFGLPAPIDLRVKGNDAAGNYR